MLSFRVVESVRYIVSQCFFYSTDVAVKPQGVQRSSCFIVLAAPYVMSEYPSIPFPAFTIWPSVMSQIPSVPAKAEHIVMTWVVALLKPRLNVVVSYNNLTLISYCICVFSI